MLSVLLHLAELGFEGSDTSDFKIAARHNGLNRLSLSVEATEVP